MKLIFSFLLMYLALSGSAQSEEQAVRELLTLQTERWNRGDIEGFMQPYWKNDSLIFIGKTGVTYGWQQTLNNYKKGYPDTASMGKLSFDLIMMKQISNDHYFVVGKWMLKRTMGDLSGHYDLLLRKINGRWFIVADHSS